MATAPVSHTTAEARAAGARDRRPRQPAKSRRVRRGAAAAALLTAGLLAVAGCGATGGASTASKNAAPAVAPNAQGSGAGDAAGKRADSAPGATTTGGTTSTGGGKATTGGASRTPAPAVYLVRTAQLTVRTPHVEQQLDKARQFAVQEGGYSGDENTAVDAGGHATSTIQLRVPAASYDALLTELAGLGTLLDRTAGVQDVTGQVVDVQSQIKSQQASVARVRKLMDQAGSLSDVVTLESELSTREADLEAMEAQQASLRSQTNLATVTLHLVEPAGRPAPPKPHRSDGFWTTVGHALGDGWHAFYVTLRVLLVVLAVLLPFALVALLGWFGYRLLRRWLPGPALSRTVTRPSLRAPGGVPAPGAGPDAPAEPLVPAAVPPERPQQRAASEEAPPAKE